MKEVDIIECLANQIVNKIQDEWKHEVCILGHSNDHINFEIDTKEYVVVLKEVKDGQHWSEVEKSVRSSYER